MIQSLSLLAYSDLGLLLAVIGVYVFFAALWLVYVTTERTAKGSAETEKRIERLRNETIQEIAGARVMQITPPQTESPVSTSVIEQIRSELATVRDMAAMNAQKLAAAETANAELMQQIAGQSTLMDAHVQAYESHVQEHHAEKADDNVVASFEVEMETVEPVVEEAPPVFKLFSPAEEMSTEESIDEADDTLSAHDPELGLVYYQRPETPDDLTRIWGVGATNQDLLNENGVFFFHQVAAWQEHHINKFNDILCFRGRIEREDWVGQAKRLANHNAAENKAA